MTTAPAEKSSVSHGAATRPLSYRDWTATAENLLLPLSRLMRPGKAELPINGPASNHGAQADRLESFARPCFLAAHWLQAGAYSVGDESILSRDRIADWFRRGLIIGTDPDHSQYWGPTTNHHQHTVEMGVLILALEMARDWLWTPLSSVERDQVASWLGSVRGCGMHRNNHLFFGVLPLCFLSKEGYSRRGDATCVANWMDTMESMAIGGGWFIDGMNETVDHYNSYGFHYYGLWWSLLYGGQDPSRAQRWQEWAHNFLRVYAHFFAASGEPIPFGRSLSYRFAASGPFALAEKAGVSPLAPGAARRLCARNLNFFVQRPIQQEQGAIGFGWTDNFPEIAEGYSCGGSPYWCAKGLAPLLIEPGEEFWIANENPMPSEQGDYACAIPQAGLVVRNVGGDAELFNAGTAIVGGNVYFGTYKWGKLSYRTGCGFEIQAKDGLYPQDAALTVQSADGTIYGRHSTHVLEATNDHVSCAYILGNRHTQFSAQIESHIWWREGWQLHLHFYQAHEICTAVLGSYSLANATPESLRSDPGYPFATASNAHNVIALQALAGWNGSRARRTTSNGTNSRTHLLGPESVTLLLESQPLCGNGWVAALSYIGSAHAPIAPCSIRSAQAGKWIFSSPKFNTWQIEHETLPALPALSLHS